MRPDYRGVLGLKNIHKKSDAFLHIYNRHKNVRRSLAVILRMWQISATGCANEGHNLQKARYYAITQLRVNPSDIGLYLANIFLYLETGDYDQASEVLTHLNSYKNWYKSNDTQIYYIIIFLESLLSIKNERNSKQKNINAFKEPVDPRYKGLCDLLYGILLYEQDNKNALAYYISSNDNGNNSVFLYVYLYKYFSKYETDAQIINASMARILGDCLLWCAQNTINTDTIINKQYHLLLQAFDINKNLKYALFGIQTADGNISDDLLYALCNSYIADNDVSNDALKCYRLAASRQSKIKGLAQCFIRASYENGNEDISAYMLSDTVFSDNTAANPELYIFIWHVMLRYHGNNVTEDLYDRIYLAGEYCLNNGIEGRYAETIYAFMFLNRDRYKIKNEKVDLLFSRFSRGLFTYNLIVNNPHVKYIYITENEKLHMTFCEVKERNATVKAVNDDFAYFCLGVGGYDIIANDVTVKPAGVSFSDERMRAAFYTSLHAYGYKPLELLIALCKSETAPDEVLGQTIESNGISAGYANELHAILAHRMYTAGKYDEAVRYYAKTDENYLEDSYIEQMLDVFIGTGHYNEAARLIRKKAHCVSDRALFGFLKSLAEHEICRVQIADAAYEILMKSMFDKTLLTLVLEHYKASLEDWEALSDVIGSMSMYEQRIDEMIIKNSVHMQKSGEGFQKTLERLYHYSDKSALPQIVLDALVYLLYEIIVNDLKVSYETMLMLEDVYENCSYAGDVAYNALDLKAMLCIALCKLHIDFGANLIRGARIIDECVDICQRYGFILPFLKNNKRVKGYTFVEKHTALCYRALPGKQVFLHYRAQGDTEYMKVKAHYFAFTMYFAAVPHFYGETLEYFFSEQSTSGSIATKENTITNNTMHSTEDEDTFFAINNALIYEQMFRHEMAEKIIQRLTNEQRKPAAGLL